MANFLPWSVMQTQKDHDLMDVSQQMTGREMVVGEVAYS